MRLGEKTSGSMLIAKALKGRSWKAAVAANFEC